MANEHDLVGFGLGAHSFDGTREQLHAQYIGFRAPDLPCPGKSIVITR